MYYWGYCVLYAVCGLAAFGLYALYDINSVLWKKRILHFFFGVGSAILVVSTVFCLVSAYGTYSIRWMQDSRYIIFLLFAAFFLWLMIHTLFFALPFDDTYLKIQGEKTACDRGMYALCRHPGVIWFILVYLNLGLAWGGKTVWYVGIWYSALNVIYVIFQDLWTFPKTFCDYGGYKKRTPFLIPTPKSVKTAWLTRR